MILAGRDGLVKWDPTGGVAVALVSIKSWTLSLATEKINVTCFQDTNRVYIPACGTSAAASPASGTDDVADRAALTTQEARTGPHSNDPAGHAAQSSGAGAWTPNSTLMWKRAACRGRSWRRGADAATAALESRVADRTATAPQPGRRARAVPHRHVWRPGARLSGARGCRGARRWSVTGMSLSWTLSAGRSR